MTRVRGLLLRFGVGLVLTACSGSPEKPASAPAGQQPVTTAAAGPLTEPPSLPLQLTLDSAKTLDAAEAALPAASPSQAPSVRLDGRGAVVTGRVRLPNACAKLRPYRWDIPPAATAAGDQRIQTVMATIVITPGPGACATSEAAVRAYTLNVEQLPPGRYSVQVVHRYDGFPDAAAAEWPSLTYALKPITVP